MSREITGPYALCRSRSQGVDGVDTVACHIHGDGARRQGNGVGQHHRRHRIIGGKAEFQYLRINGQLLISDGQQHIDIGQYKLVHEPEEISEPLQRTDPENEVAPGLALIRHQKQRIGNHCRYHRRYRPIYEELRVRPA